MLTTQVASPVRKKKATRWDGREGEKKKENSILWNLSYLKDGNFPQVLSQSAHLVQQVYNFSKLSLKTKQKQKQRAAREMFTQPLGGAFPCPGSMY